MIEYIVLLIFIDNTMKQVVVKAKNEIDLERTIYKNYKNVLDYKITHIEKN